MTSAASPGTDVLIAGAGPTGLVLALWLTRLGVRVRLVDKTAQLGTTTRAVAVQARTLELFDQIGLARTIVDRGRTVGAANLWVAGNHAAHIVFGEMGAGLSPFPYALIFSQDEHEALLTERLASLGITVERQTELEAFEEKDGRVEARITRLDGRSELCEATFIAGCDGAHSAIRETLGIGFAGGTYTHLFYVADVEAAGPVMNGEVHVALDNTDFLAAFPLRADGRARLVGTVRDDARQQGDALDWGDVSKRVIDWMHIDVARVNWFSAYRVHHRVADHFRKGRAFLLGDAAHIHSPVGGQGMNTGIGDAVNLAWKLAAVLGGRANASILDSYEPERIAFARRLVATTDRAFTAVTSSTPLARLLRLHVAPLVIPALLDFASVRRFMFRTVSQTAVNYRDSRLSEGAAGEVRGGDRLPWVRPDSSGAADNFAPLRSLDWQVHVYGNPSSVVKGVCEDRSLPLHVFPWRTEMGQTGLTCGAPYLVRPDGYIALVGDDHHAAVALTSYLDARQLRPRA